MPVAITSPSVQELARAIGALGNPQVYGLGVSETGAAYAILASNDSKPWGNVARKAGFSVGEGEGGTEFTIEFGHGYSDVSAEVLTDYPAFGEYTDTVAHTYVIPGSVRLTLAGSRIKDNGLGALQEGETVCGSIDYVTGAITVRANRFRAAGTVSVSYSYSATPEAADVPNAAFLHSFIVNKSNSTGSTDFTWSLFDADGGVAIATGSSDFGVRVDLAKLLSIGRTYGSYGKRWLTVTVGSAVDPVAADLVWENAG